MVRFRIVWAIDVMLATLLAAVPAIPAVPYALLIALAVMTGARWN
jgi:hypothetical protein